MVTLKDISASLGLSITTVSRALNGFPEVNEETRRLVEARAREMNYRPNQFAQKLVTGRSGLVGIVLKSPPDLMLPKGFVEVLTGLSASFSEMDRDFVLNVTTEADEMVAIRRLVARNTLDGFILLDPQIDDPRLAFLREKGARFVMHGRVPGDDDYPYFDIDNYRVGYDSTAHLLGLGHHRIAYLNGPKQSSYASERDRGYLAAFADAGLRPFADLLLHERIAEGYGYRAATLLADDTPPTAIICHSTQVAAEVYAVAGDRRLTIGRDLSVVAHDDGLPGVDSAAFAPPLTVTYSPIRDAIAPLARYLDGCIADAPLEHMQHVETATLLARRSTGPVPGAG
jgi:LacI family transcriptional regulator